jgi:mannose-6-phosphate isomerase-like protein (cupin superfamily)
MINGWIIGDFEPSILKTKDFEVAIKRYKAGTAEAEHKHKIAKEITIVISGNIMMGNVEYSDNQIIVIEPGELNRFQSLTDSVLAIIKMPSIIGDKYLQ